MSAQVKHIVPCQRRHYRLNVPIIIAIDGVDYETANWSISGFKLSKINSRLKPGEIYHIHVKIPFHGFDIGFFAKTRVIRLNKTAHEMAGEFLDLDARKEETLETFAKGIIRGEMAAIGGVIKKLDLPVTPASLNPEPILSDERLQEKRRLGVKIYTIGGLALGICAITLIYANFFQLRVDSAFVMGRNDVIVSPAAGYISYMAEPNTPVAAGEPIVTMTDQKLEDAVHEANFKARDAAVELSRLTTMMDLEKKRLAAAIDIVSKERDATTGVVSSLKKNLEVKRVAYSRLQALAAQGYVANAVLDRAQADYLDTEERLNTAIGEQHKREQQFSTIQAGFQIRDETVENGTHDTEEIRRAAEAKLSNAKLELQALKEREGKLAIKAPADGKLVRVFTPKFGSAQYGEPVAIFERNGTRVVQAFLTQQEALNIAVGQEAEVYFPNHWWSVRHRVTDIDFYSLTLNQTRGLFQWQNSQNDTFKTVIVTLEPIGNQALKDMQQVTPGTASKVVFPLI
jgi:multidrug resistance efflux pump